MRKTLTAAVAATMMGGLALVAPAATAGTEHYSCGAARPPQLDPNPVVRATGDVNIRRGSSTACGINGTMHPGDVLDYYCWTRGLDQATWTYLRDVTTGVAGWSRDDNLPNNGAATPYNCPA